MASVFLGVLQVLIAAGIAFYAWEKGSLDMWAAIAAAILAALLYALGGTVFLMTLLVFFLTSSLLTTRGKAIKEPIEQALHENPGARNIRQVLATSGAAVFFAILYYLTKTEIAIVGFFSAFAASNADTWASEWGVLSQNEPFSIITFKPVERGLSGGITLLGLAASILGSLLIAILYFLARLSILSVPRALGYGGIVLVSGFLGSIIDSILGATLQAKYVSAHTGKVTEKPVSDGKANVRVNGFAFISNNMVNFLSSSLAALLGLILYRP